MKRIALTLAIVIGSGLAGIGTSRVEAASPFRVQFGSAGIQIGVGHTQYGGHGYQSRSFYRGQSYGGHYDWHDTSHYDWHPGQVYRHGNHFDYTPGHYDLHQGGHYDYHNGGHGGYGRGVYGHGVYGHVGHGHGGHGHR